MKAYEDYIFGRWFYVYNDHKTIPEKHVALMIEMELGLQDCDVEQPDNFHPNDP